MKEQARFPFEICNKSNWKGFSTQRWFTQKKKRKPLDQCYWFCQIRCKYKRLAIENFQDHQGPFSCPNCDKMFAKKSPISKPTSNIYTFNTKCSCESFFKILSFSHSMHHFMCLFMPVHISISSQKHHFLLRGN